jgi:hypothetical protein
MTKSPFTAAYSPVWHERRRISSASVYPRKSSLSWSKLVTWVQSQSAATLADSSLVSLIARVSKVFSDPVPADARARSDSSVMQRSFHRASRANLRFDQSIIA